MGELYIFYLINQLKVLHKITAKADCAGDFWLVFEPAQLLLSIDLNSWVVSKTSQKVPAQTAFAVYKLQ